MKVISATLKQKKELEGTYLNGSVLEFILDSNGNFIVNENVINDEDFSEIKSKLQALNKIEFNPKIDIE